MQDPIFWTLALVLVTGTLGVLLWPLVRRGDDRAPEAEAASAAIFRDHKRQLDVDHAAGAITSEERDRALGELVQRFGDELAQAPPTLPAAPTSNLRWPAALVLAGGVPVAAAALYAWLGSPLALSQQDQVADVTDAQVVAMVASLGERLKANPEDGNGWALLGRSYLSLGRYAEADAAFAEAARRIPETPAMLADWAEAAAQAQGRSLVGRPTALLDRALAMDADHPKSLALKAAAALERNDYDTAIALWKRLKAQVGNDSAQAAQVDAVLAELESRRGSGGRAVAAPGAAGTGPGAAAAAAAPVAPASGGAIVSGRVDIAPELAARLQPGATLFVFARDPGGPRMPLAAMKLPATASQPFALTDAMSLNPQMRLSTARALAVEARVSMSGDALPRPGDLTGTAVETRPGTQDVVVRIDRVVP